MAGVKFDYNYDLFFCGHKFDVELRLLSLEAMRDGYATFFQDLIKTTSDFDKEVRYSLMASTGHFPEVELPPNFECESAMTRFMTMLAAYELNEGNFDVCSATREGFTPVTDKSEIITAIEFESYTAQNDKAYKHVMFADGSDGMKMRTNSVEANPKELHQCGLISGVFKTVSKTREEFFNLLLQSYILKISSEVHPHLICKNNEGSDIVCTWQMQTSEAPSVHYKPKPLPP